VRERGGQAPCYIAGDSDAATSKIVHSGGQSARMHQLNDLRHLGQFLFARHRGSVLEDLGGDQSIRICEVACHVEMETPGSPRAASTTSFMAAANSAVLSDWHTEL